jgi:hypothetical protein
MDVDSWFPENPVNYVADANVLILSTNNPDKNTSLFEGTTDENGSTVFSEIPQDGYYVYIGKKDQCNILEKELIDGLEVGYVIKGIFQSQFEIDVNVTLPGTSVGNPILIDVNNDGILNENDKTYGNYVTIQDNSEYTFFISKGN